MYIILISSHSDTQHIQVCLLYGEMFKHSFPFKHETQLKEYDKLLEA